MEIGGGHRIEVTEVSCNGRMAKRGVFGELVFAYRTACFEPVALRHMAIGGEGLGARLNGELGCRRGMFEPALGLRLQLVRDTL
jgi:hypothetical protein